MSDVSTLTDLPSPVNTDYLLTWRGTAPYRAALAEFLRRDAAKNAVMLSPTGMGTLCIDASGAAIGFGATYYNGNWRNTVAGQGGGFINNSGGFLDIYTGSSPGAAGSMFTDMAQRVRFEQAYGVRLLGAAGGEATLSFDAGNIGYGVRDAQIRGGQNGLNQTYLDFYTANAAAPVRAMRIDALGNVGIGTASPVSKLHVIGYVRVEGGASDTFQGVTLRNNASTAVSRSSSFIEARNANEIADATILFHHNVSGSTEIEFSVTPSGSKTSDRRVTSMIANDTTLAPGTDNAQTLGWSGKRWSVVYAGTGTINTSDERDKEWRGELNEAELEASKLIAKELGIYQWLEAITEKGEDGARLHFGARAQRVFAIMANCGLDPNRYAFCCYDDWAEQTEPVYEEQQIDTETVKIGEEDAGLLNLDGSPHMRDIMEDRPVMGQVEVGTRVTLEAGDRYGIRPDQLAFFLIAGQEQRLTALETALAA